MPEEINEQLRDFYHRYLQRCNEHRFEELGDFVHPEVRIEGAAGGLDRYIAGLHAMIEPFPDYRWNLRHLLVDGEWLSAHFTDTGVRPSGRLVPTKEFSVYHVENLKITEFWGAWSMTDSSVPAQLGDT